ncbi:uncharacterized protein LOC144108723 [Amblyomma americanum]
MRLKAGERAWRLQQKWSAVVIVLLVISMIALGVVLLPAAAGPESARHAETTTASDNAGSGPGYYSGNKRHSAPEVSTRATTGSEEVAANATFSPEEIVNTKEVTTEAENVTKKDVIAEGTTKATVVAPKLLTQRSLVCTFGRGEEAYVFPHDGLCDFSFFDSMNTKSAASLAAPFHTTFTRMLETAKTHQRTEYGVGFDYRTLGGMEDALNDPATKRNMDQLHRSRIFHFGYLNVPFFNVAGRMFTRITMVLKAVFSMMADKRSSSRPVYTVVSVGINGSGWTEWLPYLFTDTFKPDGVISLGHFAASDRELAGCKILPPTFMESPATYYHNLEQAHDGVQKVFQNTKNIAYFVSVAMYGRWYKPREEGEHDFLKPCANFTGDIHGRVVEVCKNAEFNVRYHNDDPQGALAYNSKSGKVLTYDDSTSLCQKLCIAKRNRIAVNYGIAAFNVEYSETRNNCGHSNFPRLRLLKAVVEFFSSSYTSESAYDECIMLASSLGLSRPISKA